MNPDIEEFLNRTWQTVEPTAPEIGRVVVEPDYDADLSQADASGLKEELARLLSEQSADPVALSSPDGFAIELPAAAPLLRKYIRKLSLHRNKLAGAWVEVAPPGNWI